MTILGLAIGLTLLFSVMLPISVFAIGENSTEWNRELRVREALCDSLREKLGNSTAEAFPALSCKKGGGIIHNFIP